MEPMGSAAEVFYLSCGEDVYTRERACSDCRVGDLRRMRKRDTRTLKPKALRSRIGPEEPHPPPHPCPRFYVT